MENTELPITFTDDTCIIIMGHVNTIISYNDKCVQPTEIGRAELPFSAIVSSIYAFQNKIRLVINIHKLANTQLSNRAIYSDEDGYSFIIECDADRSEAIISVNSLLTHQQNMYMYSACDEPTIPAVIIAPKSCRIHLESLVKTVIASWIAGDNFEPISILCH